MIMSLYTTYEYNTSDIQNQFNLISSVYLNETLFQKHSYAFEIIFDYSDINFLKTRDKYSLLVCLTQLQ